MPCYQIIRTQKLPATIDTIWEFISNPSNLKTITPDYMGFEIVSKSGDTMYAGMIISYIVRPVLGIPIQWVTEITHVKEKEYFVDEQRMGPYNMWHHQHKIQPIEGGVLMSDIVSYIPPFGILGSIANGLFIQKQLNGIFDYREKVLKDKFGDY